MTAPSDDRGMNRWLASDLSPSLDLQQRKLWDTLRPANQTVAADAVSGLEIAVAGADLPLERFALPDESPIFFAAQLRTQLPIPARYLVARRRVDRA